MKLVLLLLALIGASCALQYPLTYTYKYSGRIATGIPGLRAQVAGTGIRADLVLDVKTKNQAIAKLTNIEVGEYNGQVGCELREPLPIQYSAISGPGKILEECFGVSFQEEEGQVMDVPANEEEWATNIRKSIINLLRVAPIRTNFGASSRDPASHYIPSSGTPEPVFSIMENTIGGLCQSQYTLTQVPSSIAGLEDKEMEEEIKNDAQGAIPKSSGGRKATSAPQVKDQLWRLVRSINYDKCQDNVVFQQSGIGNTTKAGFGQFAYTQSRSSVGDYLLRGSSGAFRIEKAVVEGNLMIDPFGFRTERLQTISNQTMQLVSVSSSPPPNLRLPPQTRHVKTWKYEVASPYAAGGSPRSWVNFKNKGGEQVPLLPESVMTGITLTSSQINEFMAEAAKLLDDAVRELKETMKPPQGPKDPYGTSAGHAALHMYAVTELLEGLPYEKIKELFNKVLQESGEEGILKQNMLVDAIAATGTAPGVKVLLENMKTKITDQRAATIFMTLSNNLVVPSSMKPMMAFVKTLTMETHPYLTSASLVNFATLAHRVCISPHHKNFTVPTPILGKEQCEPAEIINDFLPYLKEKIQSASKPWERVVYIQALGNLGTPQSIAVLRPIVLGTLDKNPRVRTTAIYGLTGHKLPHTAREQVFQLLMALVDNIGEDAEVRQVAMAVLLSWHPDAGWWQRMARVSWREPSRQMAAFITSTIKSVAYSTDPMMHKQNKYAMYALPLARPVAPSLRYSYNAFVSKLSEKLKLITRADLAWLTNTESIFPREIYAFLKNCFGGFHFTLLEIGAAGDGLHQLYYKVMDEMQNASSSTYNPHEPSARHAQSTMNYVTEQLKPNVKSRHPSEVNMYLRVFENIQHFLPINSETIHKLFEGQGNIISKLASNQRFHLNKFFNPIPLTAIVPSDIGLPIMTKVAAPSINLAEGQGALRVSGAPSNPSIYDLLKAREIVASVEMDYKLVTKLMTFMKVLVPWSSKAVSAGLDTEKSLALPVKAEVEIINEGSEFKISTALTPKVSSKFPVFFAQNVPFTVVHRIMPGFDFTQLKDIKMVFVEQTKQPAFERSVKLAPKMTGLDATLEFEGDSVYPFAVGRIYELIRRPQHLMTLLTSPTSKMWRNQVLLNPSSSETKTIKLVFAYERTPPNGGESQYIESEYYKRPSSNRSESGFREGEYHGSRRPYPSDKGSGSGESELYGKYNRPSTSESESNYGKSEWYYNQPSSNERESREYHGNERSSNSYRESERQRSMGSYSKPEHSSSKNSNYESQGNSGASLRPEDSASDRIQKLRQFSSSGAPRNIRLAVNLLGSQKREFEFDFTWVKESSGSSKNMAEMQIALLRSPIPGYSEEPYAVCVRSRTDYPRISSMESLKSLLQSPLETKLRAQVHAGRTCESAEIATIEGTMIVSEERRRKLRQELSETCKFDPYDPTVAFHTAAVYDVASLELKYQEQAIPKPLLNMTYKLEDIIVGVTFPYNSYNYFNINNPSGIVKIEGRRSLSTEKWTLWTKKPREEFVMDSVRIPNIIDGLLPIGGLPVSHRQFPHIFLQASISDKCVVEPSRVKTFDGYTYSYEPSTCFAVAAKDCSQSEGWVLMTRVSSSASSTPEAKLADTQRNVVLEMTGGEIKVNGRVLPISNEKHIVKDSSGRFFCEIEKVSGHPEINIPGKLKMMVKERIEVEVDQRYKGAMCGLCGDFNGEVTREMTGPKHCVYHDPKLFALSWTMSKGQGCDASHLEKEKEPVKKFQEHCPKASSHSYQPSVTGSYMESDPCIEYVYPLHRMDREGIICVTTEPLPVCRPICVTVSKESKEERMKCWKVNDAPNEVREGISSGFVSSPVSKQSEIRRNFRVQYSNHCRRR